MEYKCINCNKQYSSYQSLWIHNRKFHNNIFKNDKNGSKTAPNVLQMAPNCSKMAPNGSKILELECEKCNKVFTKKFNLSRHKKICKKFQEIINNINDNKQINSNNNINSNNIINNTNQTIIINQIGQESGYCLPVNDIIKIASSGSNMPIACIKKLNFNKKLPQNHSFCTTTLEGKHFTRINHKTQQPEKVNKTDFIGEVMLSALKFIEKISLMIEFNENEFADKINPELQQKIQDILNNQNKFFETKNKRAFFNCINEISYNCKNIILDTWKLIQPVEEESDSEELLIDEKKFLYELYNNESDSD